MHHGLSWFAAMRSKQSAALLSNTAKCASSRLWSGEIARGGCVGYASICGGRWMRMRGRFLVRVKTRACYLDDLLFRYVSCDGCDGET